MIMDRKLNMDGYTVHVQALIPFQQARDVTESMGPWMVFIYDSYSDEPFVVELVESFGILITNEDVAEIVFQEWKAGEL